VQMGEALPCARNAHVLPADTSLSASTSGHDLAPAQITELVLERKHIRRLQVGTRPPHACMLSQAACEVSGSFPQAVCTCSMVLGPCVFQCPLPGHVCQGAGCVG